MKPEVNDAGLCHDLSFGHSGLTASAQTPQSDSPAGLSKLRGPFPGHPPLELFLTAVAPGLPGLPGAFQGSPVSG